jgi:hypothetical protein
VGRIESFQAFRDGPYQRMTNDETVTAEAAKGIEAAIYASTIGIVSGSGEHLHKGLGSGTLINWKGKHLILTAEHVIAATRREDFRFFLPVGAPKEADREELLSLRRVARRQLLPFTELPIARIEADSSIDLATFQIDASLDGKHPLATFFELLPGGRTPEDGHVIIGRGFPRDLMRLVDGAAAGVVFSYLEWTNLQTSDTGLTGFDQSMHFLAPFAPTEPTAHPLGLSGSAMWYRKGKTPGVWHSNLDIAGVAVAFYQNRRLTKMIRREVVEEFLSAKWL